MPHHKLNTLFIISKSRLNSKGVAPLSCRLTYNGKRKQFATGIFINPDHWNTRQQQAKPPNPENDFINSQLSLISQKINRAFLVLQVKDTAFDVEDIYLTYKGENVKKEKSFLEVLQLHNERMEKLVGIDYAPRYYQKWRGMHTILIEFIKTTYNRNDFLLNKLTMKFLDDLDFYLKTKRNQKQITVNKCIQRVRKVVRLAMAEGFLDRDPFLLYKPKRYSKKVVYLSQDELDKLENHLFAQKRLEQVRDMFIFCCYTGLAYAEMIALRKEHIITGFDGNTWIKMYRKKTSKLFSVPLLNKPIAILDKYADLEDRALPKISNQKFNSYLKEIAEIVGIEKNLTHHIARKTFATTVLLYNDVPMEIVSELLGHSKITVTQEHYAKVVQKKVSEQMNKLRDKLKE